MTLPISATTVRVDVDIAPRLANAATRTIAITARKVDDAGNVAAPISVGSCVVPAATCNLELPEGLWLLKAEAPSIYAASKSLRVGHEPLSLTWSMYQTAMLSGTFDARPPKQASSARVTLHAPNVAESAIAELPCAITERSWRCDVPQGVWDIRLRVPG
ncbi:MAG TPA: hypothetical protein VN181_01695, partial [Thermoanaerobaculia bacterium]|nr:hypothetical protein [Thermoanaerobaculia bacterium]